MKIQFTLILAHINFFIWIWMGIAVYGQYGPGGNLEHILAIGFIVSAWLGLRLNRAEGKALKEEKAKKAVSG